MKSDVFAIFKQKFGNNLHFKAAIGKYWIDQFAEDIMLSFDKENLTLFYVFDFCLL